MNRRDDDIPCFTLNAVKKSLVAQNTPVINADEFEYYVWIRIPDELVHDFKAVHIEEMGEDIRPVCIIKQSSFMGGPWYRINSYSLNMHPGYHIYRMQMANVVSNDVVSIFFAYVIQDDSPDKPYLYMDRDGKDACCCNVTSEYRVS